MKILHYLETLKYVRLLLIYTLELLLDWSSIFLCSLGSCCLAKWLHIFRQENFICIWCLMDDDKYVTFSSKWEAIPLESLIEINNGLQSSHYCIEMQLVHLALHNLRGKNHLIVGWTNNVEGKKSDDDFQHYFSSFNYHEATCQVAFELSSIDPPGECVSCLILYTHFVYHYFSKHFLPRNWWNGLYIPWSSHFTPIHMKQVAHPLVLVPDPKFHSSQGHFLFPFNLLSSFVKG